MKTRRPDLFRLKVDAKTEFYYKQQTKKIKKSDKPQSSIIYFDILFTLTTHYDDGDYIRPFEFTTYAINSFISSITRCCKRSFNLNLSFFSIFNR